MSQRPLNSKSVNERLEKAKELAKQGQYQKARYMLQDIQSNPTAKKLLQKMDGRKDRTGFSPMQFFNGTLLLIIGLSIVVILVFFNSITGFRSQIDDRASVGDQFSARGLEGNRALFVDLVYYCYETVGDTRASCLDWGETTYTQYMNQVRSCVVVDEEDGIQYRGRSYEDVGICFTEQGIPAPS